MRLAVASLFFLAAAAPALTAPTCTVDDTVTVVCPLPSLAELHTEACALFPKSHLCARLSNHTVTASASERLSSAHASATAALSSILSHNSVERASSTAEAASARSVISSVDASASAAAVSIQSAASAAGASLSRLEATRSASASGLHAHPTGKPSFGVGPVVVGKSKAGAIINQICAILGEVCQDIENGVEGLLGTN